MKNAFALIFALLVSCAAHAAPPTDASIDTLMSLTKQEQLQERSYGMMEPILRRAFGDAFKDKRMTPRQQKVMEDFPASYIQAVREEMSWAKMRPEYVRIYQETFTQEEIDGMIAFYRTPAGSATIDKMPVVMQKSMMLLQSSMTGVIKKAMTDLGKALDEAQEEKPAGSK